jgi:hypothetical protein
LLSNELFPDKMVQARNYGSSLTWSEYQNFFRERRIREANEVKRRQQEDAVRRSNEERIAREKQAQLAVERANTMKLQNFLSRAGTKEVVSLAGLCQNPFPYVGKSILVLLNRPQWEATTGTSAFFRTFVGCNFSMTSIPAAALNPGLNGMNVFAVKVLGKPQGTLQVQYGLHEPVDQALLLRLSQLEK